jgi:AraC family transcriptional regulator
MDKSLLIDLDEPRIEDGEEFLVGGLGARTNEGIPNQWRRFEPYIGNLPYQSGPETYGVCCNADNSGSFEYITGVKVTEFSDLPEGFATVRISAQRYAIFVIPRMCPC